MYQETSATNSNYDDDNDDKDKYQQPKVRNNKYQSF